MRLIILTITHGVTKERIKSIERERESVCVQQREREREREREVEVRLWRTVAKCTKKMISTSSHAGYRPAMTCRTDQGTTPKCQTI